MVDACAGYKFLVLVPSSAQVVEKTRTTKKSTLRSDVEMKHEA